MSKSVLKPHHLGSQFVFIIAGVILLTLTANAIFQYTKEKRQAEENLLLRANSIGTLLSSISIEPLLIYDNHSINELASSTSKQHGVLYTIYLSPKNNFLSQQLDQENKNIQKALLSIEDNNPFTLLEIIEKDLNILHMTYEVSFDEKKLATIKIGLDKSTLSTVPLKNLLTQVITSLIFGLIIGIVIYYSFHRKVSTPIKKLNQAANNIASFQFDKSLEIPGSNELSELADTFNLMRMTLKEAVTTRENTLKQLEELNISLEDRVKARTNELEELNHRVTHQAMHDPLTGLPNRVLVIERLNRAIEHSKRNQSNLAVFILDLNNFKEINDTLGHPEGDLVLKEVARRIPSVLRANDTVGRLGGDEFACVLPDIDEAHSIQVGNKIAEVLTSSVQLSNQMVDIGASVGIAIYPQHGDDQSTLIRHADVAMYHAKKHTNHVTIYNTNFDTHTPWRLALMADLRQAIERNELELYYQPQFNIDDRTIYGVEALLRWKHSEQGYISPDQFVYIAENSGLINTLSQWVINQAFYQWQEWKKQNFILDISINLSAKNLLDPELPEVIHQLMLKHDTPAERIKLEMTETTIMTNPDTALSMMHNPKLQNIRYSIDDFGTGYSSLSYLKKLSVDEVKIDQSFIKDMDISSSDASIVKAVIDLSHNLGHKVVAEGVETENILAALKQHGCDSAQGYLISKPLPAEQIKLLIEESREKAG